MEDDGSRIQVEMPKTMKTEVENVLHGSRPYDGDGVVDDDLEGRCCSALSTKKKHRSSEKKVNSLEYLFESRRSAAILIVAGIRPPEETVQKMSLSQRRLGMVWALVLRCAVGLEILYFLYWAILIHDKSAMQWSIAVNIPNIMALSSLMLAWTSLSKRLANAVGERDEKARARAERLATKFIVALLFLNLLNLGALLYTQEFNASAWELASAYCWWVLLANATVPVLGAIFLELAVETAGCTKQVRRLIKAAKSNELTIQKYSSVRALVETKSDKAQLTMGFLCFAAIWGIFALYYVLLNPRTFLKSSSRGGRSEQHVLLANTFYFCTATAQPTAILFTFIFLVMDVNDYADSLVSVLLESQDFISAFTGASIVSSALPTSSDNDDHKEKNKKDDDLYGLVQQTKKELLLHQERLLLILLASSHWPRPESLDSFQKFLTTRYLSPISFKLLGVRVTRNIFITSLASLIVSLPTLIIAATSSSQPV